MHSLLINSESSPYSSIHQIWPWGMGPLLPPHLKVWSGCSREGIFQALFGVWIFQDLKILRDLPCSHRMTSFDKFSVIAPDCLLSELLQATGVCHSNPVITSTQLPGHIHSAVLCVGHGHLWDVSLVLNLWTLTMAALLTFKLQLSVCSRPRTMESTSAYPTHRWSDSYLHHQWLASISH